MKVSYSWLKDFVDLKISPYELAEKLTMAGLEVVSLKNNGEDSVFEIEITSNRPDWLSIEGVAREAASICGVKFKSKALQETKPKKAELCEVKISVEEKKDCPFYSARIISQVKVAASPEWLRKRLESLGVRSINNIVDITNYILFETGHPLHAFDLDKLAPGEIIVRRAKPNEKLVTIDGKIAALDPEILVIADKSALVALAGIMGGKNTEVTESTKNILLESAVFNPVLVRRAKKNLALNSESAYRFERGADLENALRASLAAQEMILKLASGKPCGYKSSGGAKPAQSSIILDYAYVKKILGAAIPALKIKQILKSLGLDAKQKNKNSLVVKVPSFRQDLKSQIDLVEEIARIYGYAKIPASIPAIKPVREIPDKGVLITNMKSLLSGMGLYEVITYSLLERGELKKLQIDQDAPIEVLNPLSLEQEVLRTTLLPSLVNIIARNLDRGQQDIGIFEIADSFFEAGKDTSEEPRLGIALSKNGANALHLKGILEVLHRRLGITNLSFARQDAQKIDILINREKVGFILDLDQKQLAEFEIKKADVVLAELELEKLFKYINLNKKFSAIPKFPAISRDISFIVKKEVLIASILAAIEEKGTPLLKQARISDYYQGKQIPEGYKGLTVSCIYRLDERTLTEEEVSPLHNEISLLLKERFDIKLR